MDNYSMFSNVFFELIANIDSKSNHELLSIKREFKIIKEDGVVNSRDGMQSKMALFFDCFRHQVEQFCRTQNKLNNDGYLFLSKVVEAIGVIVYQSVRKNRGINYPCKESLEKIIGSFKTNVPKANEKFSANLFAANKKMSITTISELVGFIYLLIGVFGVDIDSIEDLIVQELRKHVKIYVNNETFIKQLNCCKFEKYVVIDKETYDFSNIIDSFNNSTNLDNSCLMLCELLFILLYFTDCKTSTKEAKDSFIQWINDIQDEKLQIANGYSKYLWIRYRRLPEDELSAECLNGFTIDNLYVFPNVHEINNSTDKLLTGFFDKDNQARKRRIVIGGYGEGKTSLINAIVSMIATSSDYAYKDKNISQYFIKYYAKIKDALDFNTSNVFPMVASCRKFDSFMKTWNKNEKETEPTILDFVYYLIVSYNEELNIMGERNKGWYEKWISSFSLEQFEILLNGAVTDDRLLLLIDDFEVMNISNKVLFEKMLKNFLICYGSNCEIIITATDQSLAPNVITQIKNGYDVFVIDKFDEKSIDEIFSRHYTYFNDPGLMQSKKDELIHYYDLEDENIGVKEKAFEAFIKNKGKGARVLGNKAIDPSMIYNPFVLCKLAQNSEELFTCEIENIKNDLFFDLLPVLSINETLISKVLYIIPKKLFDAINNENELGNDTLGAFYNMLNKKNIYIKNHKIQKTILTCNQIIDMIKQKEER